MIIAMILTTLTIDNILPDFKYSFGVAYIGLIIFSFFICFIIPGLLDKTVKMYNAAILLLLYFIATLIFLLLLQSKNEINYKIFIPFYAVFGTHLILSAGKLFDNKNNILFENFKNFAFVLFFIVSIVVITLKVENMIGLSWTLCYLPLFVMIMVAMTDEFPEVLEKYC